MDFEDILTGKGNNDFGTGQEGGPDAEDDMFDLMGMDKQEAENYQD